MERKGMKQTSSTFGLMISGFYREDNKEDVLAMMKGRGISVGVSTHNIRIQSLCKRKMSVEAKALLDGMKPNAVTYGHLIHGFCNEGEFDEAKKYLRVWSMQKNWVPSFGIMKSLVNGLAKDSKVEEAKELITQVKEKFTRNVDLWNEVETAFPQ
ncbi:hypothetical protein Bca4012_030730 [Brassica carinata]